MTRRERFQAVMDKKPVDRVPFDLAGTSLTGIDMPELVRDIRRLLEIEGEYTGSYDKFDERILKALDIDFRRVGSIFEPESPLKRSIGGKRCDCWGVGREFTGLYWDITEHPLKGAAIEDLDAYPWPKAGNIAPELIKEYTGKAKWLYEDTDYVVCAEHPFYGVMEIGCWMMGFDEYLYKMAAEPEFIHKFSSKILQYQKEVIDLYYGALGRYIHLTTSGDDFGTQTGSFISKQMFDEMVAPYMKERIRLTKEHTDAGFFHHTCGSVFNLIPSFIDMGVELLNPIQPKAKNMEPRRLKEAYGHKLTFWGGVDTQELLVKGSKAEIRSAVCNILTEMENTGYVLSPAHNLQGDVKPENVIEIYKAARDHYSKK